MEAYEAYLKLQAANDAIEEFQKDIAKGKTSTWDDSIRRGYKNLLEKRLAIGASGTQCPTCNGSGRI
jgi:hypothetical protein